MSHKFPSSYFLVALAALCVNSAVASPIRHSDCRVTTKLISADTDRLSGAPTGKFTLLSGWFEDIQGKNNPGFLASSDVKARWIAMAAFLGNGYSVVPLTGGADSFDGLADNDLEMTVLLYCDQDSSYFCAASLRLNAIAKDPRSGTLKRTEMARYATPNVVPGRTAVAAMHNAVAAGLGHMPSCQKE